MKKNTLKDKIKRCESKRYFGTLELAKENTNKGMKVYHCTNCDGYHRTNK